VVGGDFPQEHMDLLASKGVDLAGLQIKADEKTFFWSGKYHLDMNSRDTVDTQLNVLADFDPVVPEAYFHCRYLMLGNLVPAVQKRVLAQLPQRPKLIVLDTMNFWMENALPDLLEALHEVDVLTINDEEARLLSGELNLVKAARKIRTMGPKILIIKKGEHGALLFGANDEIFFAPALPLADVVDPTGAGDTFAGGFIGYLAQTDDISFENMKRALLYAATMASFCVEKFGTERLHTLTTDEVAARRAEFTQLVHVHPVA
jgi:hydroxymethylpyrimidine/phosphomethylpyrimidine kinase